MEEHSGFFILPVLELLKRFAIIFAGLAILDFGLCYRSKARYFFLHAYSNLVITILCLPGFVQSLLNPFGYMALHDPADHWPVLIVISLHLWHCIAYSGLTYDDWFHHFMFAFSLGGIALFWDLGCAEPYFLAFVCGLPGGLDYYWLGLVKEGRIQKIDEKRWNAKMNTWCRAPGCVSSGVLIYANAVSGMAPHIPWPLKVILAGLSFMNGQYYGQRVVASWAVHELQLKGKNNSTPKAGSIDQSNNPLTKAQRADGWQSVGFSPQTRKVVAESYESKK